MNVPVRANGTDRKPILAKQLNSEARVYTDHLNSAPFLEDSDTLISPNARLSYMNGRSYYQWMIGLYQRSMVLLHLHKRSLKKNRRVHPNHSQSQYLPILS